MGRLERQFESNRIRLLGMLYAAHLYRKDLQRTIDALTGSRPLTRPETRVVKS